jgi:hypothetical protein
MGKKSVEQPRTGMSFTENLKYAAQKMDPESKTSMSMLEVRQQQLQANIINEMDKIVKDSKIKKRSIY